MLELVFNHVTITFNQGTTEQCRQQFLEIEVMINMFTKSKTLLYHRIMSSYLITN